MKDEPETRVKIVNYQALSNKFSQIIKESQAVQIDFKQAVKNKIARQARIYDGKLTDQEIEEITNDPEVVQENVAISDIGSSQALIQ